MAIQLRRGDYTDFDPSQLLDGELAVVLENDPDTDDGTGTYVSYGEGNVKRLLTEDDTVDVDVATTTTAGIVKPDGTTITVDNDGTIHGSADVPIATTGVAGKVRPDGISITVNEDGEIRVPEATYDSPGIVQPDNTTITVTEYGGYIRVPTATNESLGLVQPDGETLDIDSNGVLSVIGIDPYNSDPEMDGSPSAGSSDAYARGDHMHPTDTSRASASDLTSHVGDSTAHVTAAERSTWNAKASTATATTSANGLMSASDKAKLDGIESGANAYELPLMSESTRGGAKLGHGLAIEDGALGIGEVTDPTDAGPIVELTAKGWAEQNGTPSPSYPQEIRRVTGHTISGKTGRFVDILVTHNGTTTTIPIPLPSRGWVAALPDGTADTLTLDGAGGYEWELNTHMTTQAVTDGVTGTVGVNVMSSTGQIADGATVLYKGATTTESGYVDSMPTVPIHAAITTDLHDLAVRCCADSGAAEIASAWGRRYESRIANLESAVATLVAAGA